MLSIKNLQVKLEEEDKQILKGVDLEVEAGKVHAIMGPNGSGKSTLANVLAGHPTYAVTSGTVTFDGEDLLALAPEERARRAEAARKAYFAQLAHKSAKARRRRPPKAKDGAAHV